MQVSDAESVVMEVLWDAEAGGRGAVAAEDVVAVLATRQDWQEATIKTLLNRLLKKGAIRRLVMTDGVPLDEEFVEFEPPRKVHYKLKGFRGPLALIAKHCEGQWVFSPLGNGTRISWTFTAHLTSPLAAPAAIPVIKVFMKQAMETSLQALKSRV